jgi:predicted outer membrane protein
VSPKIFVIAVAIISSVASGAAARQRVEAVANPADETYVQELALEGIAALELGYDALQLATRRDVREFALDSVNLHAPALKQLEWFASEHKVAFPSSLAGRPEYRPERPWEDGVIGFDRAFMESQVRMLERESEAITRVATFAEDPVLRTHAWSRLAVVRQQLARAEEIVWQLDLDDVR